MTQSFQDSLEATSRSLITTHQNSLNQLQLHLRSLQESQNQTQATLHKIDSGFARLIEPIPETSMTQSGLLAAAHRSGLAGITRSPSPVQSLPMLSIHVSQATHQCQPSCSCQCHAQTRWSSPQLLKDVIGVLLLGYSKAPTTLLPCDRTSCSGQKGSKLTVVYLFPSWFWQRALLIVLYLTKRDGPVISLRTMRRRRMNDVVFQYVRVGDLERLRSLFQLNEASPFDLSSSKKGDVYILAVSTHE